MQATERIQLRTTPHTKAMLEQASQALGVSMSYFILDSAYQRASQTIKETTQITLTSDEWQQAIDRLDTPAKPAKAMQSLFDRGFVNVDN
ncbi:MULTISPECIES: DUF1778 domain-containing protein [unclassified Moraxella]|uniref:type II toxin-antitoxin system TacA family antitoxin n=1 Tax=unclassified Moraxella TaxID=2685852 RepID=UPI00359CE780